MNRRDTVIALLAFGIAPLAARAQLAKIPQVGVLTVGSLSQPARDGLLAGLREHGFEDGKNMVVVWRASDGRVEQSTAMAQELVRMNVDVIFATPTQAVIAVQAATKTIPIVMTAGDPIRSGFVASLGRPGGNITGVTTIIAELGPKLLELIRELRPGTNRVAILIDPRAPFGQQIVDHLLPAADKLGVRAQVVTARGPAEIDAAFAAIAREKAGAVIIQPSLATRRAADLALKQRLLSATSGIAGAFPDDGGLLYYGSKPSDQYRAAAVYVSKILKGAKPADLPVEQPTVFELVINRKTAKVLGVTIPQTLLLRADRVVE